MVSRSKYGPRAAAGCVGPQALRAEHGAKRNFTTKYGRERAIMFNQLSLGKKKEKKYFEHVLFPIIMGRALPFQIGFSEQQKSFTPGEHTLV